MKTESQKVTEKLVEEMVGKLVHAKKNPHEVVEPIEGEKEVNVWFAGWVAGYEKAMISFDYAKGEWLDKPQTVFNILLSDGMAYVLSERSEVVELSEEDFVEMIAQEDARKALSTQEDKKILRMGRDF